MKFLYPKIILLLLSLAGSYLATASDNPMQLLEDKGYQLGIISSSALNKTFASYSGNHAPSF